MLTRLRKISAIAQRAEWRNHLRAKDSRLRTGPKQMNGRFQPGRSGNPGGRPKAAHSIQELARKHTIEALDVLVQIMLNEKAPPNARVAAANTLLDRAYGKAPTFSTSDTKPLNGPST